MSLMNTATLSTAVPVNPVPLQQDAAVIGIDDIDMASYLTPALSTVALPKEQIVEISANLLIDLMKGKPVQTPRFLLDPALVIRETT